MRSSFNKKPKKVAKNRRQSQALAEVDRLNGPKFVQPAKPDREKVKVKIPAVITVKDFAEKTSLPASEIISQLFKSGVLATINDAIDFDTAAIVGDDLGLEVILSQDEENTSERSPKTVSQDKNLKPRPPVVTVMGHVDHGKTTLLDKIRQAHVVESESGGITQHISAYQVTLKKIKNKKIKNRTITFIDTPGHAAFSALRSHGAAITDIVVLIVSAVDGVMPQTVEVIEQAQKNNVPIIVALNKMDLPGVNLDKVKKQLSEHKLIPEEWGGKTVMVSVSAKTGEGVDELLEMILLQADLMDISANPDAKAAGVVIESHMHKGAGALAVVLIENGTLRLGDAIQVGSTWGKIRIMEDFAAKPIKEATPGMPVRVAGIRAIPGFGDRLVAFDSEKESRDASELSRRHTTQTRISTAKKVIEEEDKSKDRVELNIILKADVQGSLEAIKKMISEIKSARGKVKIVSEGIGAIAESDVSLAHAVLGTVYGFRVKQAMSANKIAEKDKVVVKTFDIIYQLMDDIKVELGNLLPPIIREEEIGRGQVLAIFRDDKKGVVIGCKVSEGSVSRNDQIKLFQGEDEKWRGEVLSLRKGKDEVKVAGVDQECGIGLAPFAKVAVGDRIQTFKIIKEKQTVE